MTIIKNGNLAISSGFFQIEESAPHGTNHAAYAISRGLAEHGQSSTNGSLNNPAPYEGHS